MDNSPKSMNRRQFIKAVGAGAAIVALGNCSGESNTSGPGEELGNGENSSSSNAASSSSKGNPSSSSAASSSSRGSSSSSSSSSRGSSSSSSRENPSSSSEGNSGKSKVYFTSDISPAGLMAAFVALNQQPSGNVAVKLSIGEPGSNYLKPALIKDLVQSFNGTIVECNTLYSGPRDNTESHKKEARDHGYNDIANVDILDENGSMTLPVQGGTRLRENKVGKNFANYDYFVVLSHFKGHTMGGFGGALKNISIGIASKEGKDWIHTAGGTLSSWTAGGVPFLESMAEAGKSVVDSLKGKILYINVMNKLSVDCDCFPNPAAPKMDDIGILSSLDPVALDQACVDLVYNAPKSSSSNNADLIKRMEDRKGIVTVEHAAEISLGSREYDLINL